MDDNQSFLQTFEEKKLPGSINVLTILTFIGCGLVVISAIYGYTAAESAYERTKEAIESGKIDQLPSFLKNMMSPEMLEMQRKSMEYKLPILLINLVTAGLCIFGAIQMRKRKAEGFWIWLIGEILPFFSTFVFLGFIAYSSFFSWISILITLVFVALYASQRKYLS